MSSPILILVGVAALLFMIGAGVALLAGGGQKEVDERLEEFVASSTFDVQDEIVDATDGPDVADKLDKALSGRNFFAPLKERLSRSDVKLRVSEYVILIFISAGLGAGAGYLFFDGKLFFILAGALLGMRLPRMYVSFAANRRMNTFNDQLGDTLNLWVNALRSGYSVLQGMETIATELPPPVSVEFERVVQEVRLGLSVEQALNNMYRRVPSEDLDLVITAVNIQREVGGNLAEVLDTISFTIRERVRIKGEIRTLTAQGRISAWIISLLPVALGLLLYSINPGYVSELWVKEAPFIIPGIVPCGWIVLGIGAIMIGLGAFAVQKTIQIEV
ncbi:MAG: type II secretion system F family protein [Ardenticatenaceae bacterium]|nr:type II secretion system F family protein [Anaerolineales bacterium]MCB8923441.1 type II secretion system F family protein [Ardenticatenaceae bacterium]MCB8991404.1 type II secretion system F family protein [Ardenticatenaceae bacterium]MCB9003834.1 type II secretion system F family protein [Ardenticatenaceae bacterium]